MTAQSTWTELVAKNPMLIEVSRYRRKLFSLSRSNPIGGLIVSVVAISYVGIVAMIVTFRADISPFILVDIQTAVFLLLAPILLHSAIAGERERRSWDLLLAAPITKAQIVVGKFLGALSAMAVGAAFFVFPIAVTAFSYHQAIYDSNNETVTVATQQIWGASTNFWNLALAEAVCLSSTALVSAVAIFFSARVKRSFMALGTTLGLMVLGLLVLPAMATPTGYNGADAILFMHPVYALGRLAEAGLNPHTSAIVSDSMVGIPQILVYLGLSGVMLAWAINTLNFAENEVKFLPKAKTRC